jgi:hypothetical protein
MHAMIPTWRATRLAIALAVAAVVRSDAPPGVAPAIAGAAVGGALMIGLAAVLLGLLGWRLARARGLAHRVARAESRLRRAVRAARDLREAAVMLPAAPGGGPRGDFERRCMRALATAEAGAAEAAACRAGLRRGLGLGQAARAEALDLRADGVEADLLDLERRLAGVREELTATTACLESATAAIATLCAAADRPGPGRVWCEDLRGRIADARKALDTARADLLAGRTLEALRAGRRLRGRLQDLRRMLEARQASLAWLEGVPAQAVRLAEEAAAMKRLGYRGVPELPAEAIAAEARAAVAALQGGDPRRAAAIQATLRTRLDGFRRATVGRGELRAANDRKIEAVRSGLALLEAAIDGLPSAAVRRRFAQASWAGPALLEDRLVARAREVGMTLRRAAQANHLDAQAFEDAARLLAQADAALAAAHEEVARCAAAWRAPAEEEARLQSRLAALHGEVGAAYARARGLGLAPGPGIEGLLVAARTSLRQEPVDLAAVRRPIEEAERVLARFHAHLDEADREAAARSRWRPGPVVIVPPTSEEAEAARSASDRPSERH